MTERVLIIGGGIIGAATAYYLRRKGWAVTLVEKDRFGRGASWGNCGIIVPSHLLPLNTPGNLKNGLKWLLRKDAPLYIKPGIAPDRLRWFFQFARHCNPTDIRRAVAGRAAMLTGAVDLFDRLIQRESISCEWEHRGALLLFRSRHERDAYGAVDTLTRRFGFGATRLDRRAVLDMEPSLSDRVAGGWFDPSVAHLRPDTLMEEFNRVLLADGVEILEETEVKGFRRERGRAVAAVSDRGALEAGEFVVATGAWTPRLNRTLGIKIPIEPGKGYSVTGKRSSASPSIPCFLEEARVVATPWESGCRLGGTMEFAGYDDALNQRRIAAIMGGAGRYFRTVEWDGPGEAWCGLRPMTFDGLPIIDRPPGLANVMIAAGHNMLGISLANGTGKLVSELLSGDAPHLDPSPYRIDRFL